MGFYEDKRDLTVKPLLTRYGTNMKLLVPGEGVYDPDTGGLTAGAEASHTVLGLFGAVRKARKGDDAIQLRSRYVYLSPSGMRVEPTPGHKIKYGDVEYEVLNVEVIAPGGVAVLYQLEVRLP